MWLEEQQGEEGLTEVSLAERLNDFRRDGELFQDISFSTIVGYQANSAVGHYSPQPETTPTITWDGVLLADSGGQYLDGTTDITRTVRLGEAGQEEKLVFTAVLQSLIKLTTASFPQGTTGSQLDALAREPLWRQHWNCRHGIGHGVGHFLNVHEGPQRFSPGNHVVLEAGMVITIEPGVYFEGAFGVRLENMVIVTPVETTAFGMFYGFETLTLCPIDVNLVELEMLSHDEKGWLNQYHQLVFERLSPDLEPAEKGWLYEKTRPMDD
jgi:Xaa-Pro aminopeptidase